MKKRNFLRAAASVLCFLLLFWAGLSLLNRVLRPYHEDYGAVWEPYLAEPEDSMDLLFLGSSYAYCDWDPLAIYEATGLTGYVMGGSEQPPLLTYWYLREALRTQHPKAVMLESTGLFFQEFQNYTQPNIVYMPWGLNRLGAILTAAEKEKWPGLFFEPYFYHSRILSLTLSDLQNTLRPRQIGHLKGHTMVDSRYDQASQGPIDQEIYIDEARYEENLKAFSKIADLCREEGIALYLTFNPTYRQHTDEFYAEIAADLRKAAPDAVFLNWARSFDDFGLDPVRHLYDAGHLNHEGAEIFSRAVGAYLLSQGLTPGPHTAETAALWAEAMARRHAAVPS